MKIEIVVVGDLDTNCYLLKKGQECLVIDPGDEAEKIKKAVGDISVKGILITHRHFDHIGALEDLKQYYQVSVYEKQNLEEGKHKIGNFEFEVIDTPGHLEDSICFLFNEKVMFVGDFIFKGSIGRTDLPGGDFKKMQESIKKIKQYSGDIILYPGHGMATTLQEEKENNYFFQ